MPDILHDFPIQSPIQRVFEILVSPEGLDAWWTRESGGTPALGAEYRFWFGPEYDWRGVVSAFERPARIEWRMTVADADWLGTRVGFRLSPGAEAGTTQVEFRHLGWPERNAHYRISCFCWAMYLRLLRRYLERGEVVPYDNRLDV